VNQHNPPIAIVPKVRERTRGQGRKPRHAVSERYHRSEWIRFVWSLLEQMGWLRLSQSGKPVGPMLYPIGRVLKRCNTRRRIVEGDLEQLVSAQIAAAKGIRFLVLQHRKTGQFVKRLTPRSAHTYLKDRAEYELVEVWQKDPSTAAFRELMAHAIDLPKQQEQELRLTAEWRQLVAILGRPARVHHRTETTSRGRAGGGPFLEQPRPLHPRGSAVLHFPVPGDSRELP
jgi:hypothetical protein